MKLSNTTVAGLIAWTKHSPNHFLRTTRRVKQRNWQRENRRSPVILWKSPSKTSKANGTPKFRREKIDRTLTSKAEYFDKVFNTIDMQGLTLQRGLLNNYTGITFRRN